MFESPLYLWLMVLFIPWLWSLTTTKPRHLSVGGLAPFIGLSSGAKTGRFKWLQVFFAFICLTSISLALSGFRITTPIKVVIVDDTFSNSQYVFDETIIAANQQLIRLGGELGTGGYPMLFRAISAFPQNQIKLISDLPAPISLPSRVLWQTTINSSSTANCALLNVLRLSPTKFELHWLNTDPNRTPVLLLNGAPIKQLTGSRGVVILNSLKAGDRLSLSEVDGTAWTDARPQDDKWTLRVGLEFNLPPEAHLAWSAALKTLYPSAKVNFSPKLAGAGQRQQVDVEYLRDPFKERSELEALAWVHENYSGLQAVQMRARAECIPVNSPVEFQALGASMPAHESLPTPTKPWPSARFLLCLALMSYALLLALAWGFN